MSSADELYDKYGIVSEMDGSGRIRFSGIGCLPASNESAWQEVQRLMIDVEQNGRKYLQQDDRVIITGERQMLILFPGEIRNLLKHDLDLYVKALKRGKSEKRLRASEKRRNGA